MTQFSPYFDGEKRKTTWSPTYQRIFRSFYPDGSWKDMEKDAEPTAKPKLENLPLPASDLQTKNFHHQESSQSSEFRSNKRVSINDDEAQSELSRRSFDRQASGTSATAEVEEALMDEDLQEFVRGVVRREFPEGIVDVVECNREGSSTETIFKRTLRLSSKEKTIFVHVRNHVSTSAECRNHTADSLHREATFSPSSTYSERVDDNAAHTKSSSWAGPYVPTPVSSSVTLHSFQRSFSTPQKHDGPHKAELSDLTALTSDEAPADTLERKLLRSEPLEREEFYALKQIHCAQVQSKEEELLRLQHLPQERTNEISILRKALDYLYQTYEEILETARPVNEYSVILAHRILLADAYLFHARIKQTNRRSQRKLYHMAVEIYGDLLGLARRCLPPDDTSLLSIAERLSLILRESRSLKPSLILEVTSVLDDAELSLKGESNAEAERKIGQARQNLGALGANYYLHI